MNESLNVPLSDSCCEHFSSPSFTFWHHDTKVTPNKEETGTIFVVVFAPALSNMSCVFPQAWKDLIYRQVQQVKTDSTHWPLTPALHFWQKHLCALRHLAAGFPHLTPNDIGHCQMSGRVRGLQDRSHWPGKNPNISQSASNLSSWSEHKVPLNAGWTGTWIIYLFIIYFLAQ